MGNKFTRTDEKEIQGTDNIHVKNYVKTLLKDKRINNSMIPDAIEQKLYEQLIGTVIADLTRILEDAKVEILGHEIKFIVSPIITSLE